MARGLSFCVSPIQSACANTIERAHPSPHSVRPLVAPVQTSGSGPFSLAALPMRRPDRSRRSSARATSRLGGRCRGRAALFPVHVSPPLRRKKRLTERARSSPNDTYCQPFILTGAHARSEERRVGKSVDLGGR